MQESLFWSRPGQSRRPARIMLSLQRLLIPSSKRLLRCPPLSLHGFCKGYSTSDAIDMAYSSFQPDDVQTSGNLSPIIIMHRLMGSKRNWRTIAKAISAKTGQQVFTVDARNHGNSPHTDQLCYSLLVKDILKFMESHAIPKATLMGDCMGGKAAMLTALEKPAVVDKLLVLDVSPYGLTPHAPVVPVVTEIMKNMKIPDNLNIVEARKYVDSQLMSAVPESDKIRQFLVTNVSRTKDGYKWISNVEAIANSFNPHMITFPFPKNFSRFEGKTAFVVGSRSDYLRPGDDVLLQEIFPQVTFHSVEGVAHSPHFEKPGEFLDIIVSTLKE